MKRAPEGGLEGLKTKRRTSRGLIALVAVGIVAASVPALAAAADPSSTPDPKQLWDSYPLAPGGGSVAPDPAPTPTASASASPTASPTPAQRAPAAADDGSSTALVIGGSIVAFAFGIGAGEVWRRRRRAAATPIAAPAPAARERPAPGPAPPPAAAAAPDPQPAKPKAAPARPAKPKPKPARPARPKPTPSRPAAPKAKPSRPAPEPEPATAWLEPEPPPPAPAPVRRFASAWPEGAAAQWTCEIDWKAGYRSSSFRAMAGAPGATKRHPLGESSAGRWTLMADPEPPTPELVACVRDLRDALQAAGWEDVGRGRHWYALRFVWTHTEDPRPLEPQTRKAKHV